MVKQITKIIITTLVTLIPDIIGRKMMEIKKEEYDLLSEDAYKKSKAEIIQMRNIYLATATLRSIIFYTLYVIVTGFCFYYVIIFCSVYEGSSKNWVADCWIGIIFMYLESLILLIILVLFRWLMRTFPNIVTKGLYFVISLIA